MNGRVVVSAMNGIQRFLIDELSQVRFALVDVNQAQIIVDINVVCIRRQGHLGLSDGIHMPTHSAQHTDGSHHQPARTRRVLNAGPIMLKGPAILTALLGKRA